MTEKERRARFEAAMLPHLDAAYNLARWLVGNPHDAEDAVQDAYLRALTYFDAFHGEDGRGWLFAIVRNACYQRLRKIRRSVAVFEPVESLEAAADHKPGPEALHLREADRQTIERGLECLPPEYREVLVLREMEGMSYKQIARIIEAPIGTVMSRLARGRRRLQEILTGETRKETV
ncbi:MAG: RNA polymerase subunit sigma [Terriglobia bacterium]|nr:MAG: RNA polymerase subunit sigma [Terriglobia bacterium]